jgi:hypothetical protein
MALTSLTLPPSLTTLGGGVFEFCSGLTTLSIPSTLTSIGSWCFSGCSSLQSITIPSGTIITTAHQGLFYNCRSLTSCSIQGNGTGIAQYMFYKCTSLTSFTIPSTTTIIDSYAFQQAGLTSLTIPSGVTTIGTLTFAGTKITSLTIPSSVTSLNAPGCCINCTSLTSVTFTPASSVTTISHGFFYNCTNLSSITLASTITTLFPYAFANTGFTTITMPSVTSYFYGVFAGCQNLTSVTLGGNSGFPHSTSFINTPLLTSPPIAKRSLSAPLVNGNGTITPNASNGLNDTGALNMTLNGGGTQDTGFYTLPAAATSGANIFNFNFFGTNYGAGANPGITFSTNLAVGFGNGTTATSISATLGRYIFTGIANRFVNRCAYTNPVTNGSHRIVTIYLFYENGNSQSSSNVYAAPGQMQIRFIKNTSTGIQYIEFRFYKGIGITNDGSITNVGSWQLTNGTAFQNTFTLGTGVTFYDNDSIVLSSDSLGNTWTFNPYCHVNL